MPDLYHHLESCHQVYFRNSPITCSKCREDLSTDKNGAPHHQSQCVRTTAGESGIMLVSELKRCRQNNVGKHAEKAWVHYSTKNDGDRPPTSQLNIAGPAPTVPYGTQFVSNLYQDGVQVAQYQPVPRVRNANSQQLPRQDSNLQATQNEARSGKKRKKSQQALPQATHSQLNGNGTLAHHQEQVNQYAPQPQASHLQLAQTSHQSQNWEQPQQSRAEPVSNYWTQSLSFEQPPFVSSHQPFYGSSGPSMTPGDISSMQGSSINQHSLDVPDPQSQGYSTSNEFNISSNSLQSNMIPAEIPSEVTGSMAPQHIGVSQPQHLDEALVHFQSINWDDLLKDYLNP
ncbi:uncharacterized protein FTJAE_7073 [Fusarium tjaetaba]|uniref:Uncharacterized protein n=1 Tax=Fusarium tjaetaba TaxID=1567544 RepID=A0A8H5VTA5_9HYPO|nr:uncharacterized protein FTJAE_7073 [Fusarium tjaetaba]KAF5633648.1 hypothetical protein FTJAE_7073 [Fusarium tjaetaba]